MVCAYNKDNVNSILRISNYDGEKILSLILVHFGSRKGKGIALPKELYMSGMWLTPSALSTTPVIQILYYSDYSLPLSILTNSFFPQFLLPHKFLTCTLTCCKPIKQGRNEVHYAKRMRVKHVPL